MKRLLLIIIALSFFLAPCVDAKTRLLAANPVYKSTITGLRVSAVDGTAFIDNLPLVYSSDFSAGVDGWGVNRGAVAGNIDSIESEDNWLRYTIDTQTGVHYVEKTNVTPVIGRQYKISIKYYIPAGQTALAGIKVFDSSNIVYSSLSPMLTVGSVTTYSGTFTASATGPRR
jgi:hypothetical protein